MGYFKQGAPEEVSGIAVLFWILIIGLVVLLVGGCVWAVPNYSSWKCAQEWPERATRWTPGGGCQVEYQGEWVPSGSLRLIDD